MENYNFQTVLLFVLHNFHLIPVEIDKDFMGAFARITAGYFLLEELLKRPEAQGEEFNSIPENYESISQCASEYVDSNDSDLIVVIKDRVFNIQFILNKFWLGGDVLKEYEDFKNKNHLKE